MTQLFKLTTPVYGLTDVPPEDFIDELNSRMERAQDDNEHFDHGFARFSLTADENGGIWLTGFTKKDGACV